MLKKFRKKKVLMRSARKKKKATVSIHRAKHRWYKIKQASLERYLEKEGALSNL
jgi:hypothetical protein